MIELKPEIQMYLEDETDHSAFNKDNSLIMKSPLSNGLIAVMISESDLPTVIRLVGYYNKPVKKFLGCFCNPKEILKEVDELSDIVKTEDCYLNLQKAIKEEFKNILSLIEYDSSLEKDEAVIEMAEKAFLKRKSYNPTVPEISFEYGMELLGEILKDVNETAYKITEKYLINNPAYVRECQRIQVANKLMEDMKTKIGDKTINIMFDKERIQEILTDSSHKSVKVTFELNDGSEFTESVKTPMNLHVLPPYYSVKRISWKKDVLYERDESKAEDWKQDLAENLEWLEKLDYNFVRYYNLSQPYKSFISKSALNKREFALNFLVVNPEDAITMINPKFKTDFSFVKDYIRKTDNIYKVKSVLELFPSFLSDVEFYKYWFRTNKSYLKYESYKDFIIEAKRDKEILQIFIEGADYEEVQRELNTFVLNTPTLIHFVESILVKCPEKSYNEELLASCENRQIAINILKRSSRKGFDEVNKTITVDKDFILETLPITEFRYHQKKKLQSLKTNPTLSHFLEDEDIKMAFICSSKRFLKDIISEFEITTSLMEKIYAKDEESIQYICEFCKRDNNLKSFLLNHPKYTEYIVDSRPYGLREEMISEAEIGIISEVLEVDVEAIKLLFQHKYFPRDEYEKIIATSPSIFKALKHEVQERSEILELVKYKSYVLPYFEKGHDFACLRDEEFVLAQANLANDDTVLKYCSKPDKRRWWKASQSLHYNKEFVLKLIKQNPQNIYDLYKKSVLWQDIDFAKEVLKIVPAASKLFPLSILENKEVKTILA